VTFDEFVRAHAAGLHATAWLLCGNREDARDLVQSTLLVVFRRWERLTQENLRGYAVTVLAHEHRRAVRTTWRRSRAERLAAPHEPLLVDPADPQALQRWLAALPPRQRAAVVLRVVADMSERDVAAALGCSVGTVKSQTSRALAALRATVRPEVPQ
jgi:RNA polymerase sigma-70 factor (sigma-E family)